MDSALCLKTIRQLSNFTHGPFWIIHAPAADVQPEILDPRGGDFGFAAPMFVYALNQRVNAVEQRSPAGRNHIIGHEVDTRPRPKPLIRWASEWH